MIRFVVGPDGEAVPDLKNKLPGRGIWVTASRDALGEAVKKRAFARGFKRDVRVPADLVERTEAPAGARRVRCARHGRQGGSGPDRVRQGRGGAGARPDGRRAACLRCRPGWGPKARSGAPARAKQPGRASSTPFLRHNWIWHWASQMWYMLPCSPAQRAIRFWRVASGLNGFGPAIRANRTAGPRRIRPAEEEYDRDEQKYRREAAASRRPRR